ncbi:MAG TPA: type II secretion system protein [Gemmatimonadaceae bacterium]|nr:type II secretion system protein [Gemmatimonadaceae bacterium]
MRPDRRAFSLVELIAVIALAGLVAAMAVATISRQQQFYRASAELILAREGVRDAMEVLTTDIRGASTTDTLRVHVDSAIELFAPIGGSVVCQIRGNEIGLPPSHPFGNSFSSFLTEPDTGDIALFYVDSADVAPRWTRYRVASFASSSAATTCATSSFSSDAERASGARSFALSVATALSPAVQVGTPVRFIRRARYSLYRASDGNSYLGYRRCNADGPSVCGAIQPVSGPYRAYSPDPRATGLLFEYFGTRGELLGPTASSLDLARVVIIARSKSGQGSVYGSRAGTLADSGTVSIALRNLARQ